MKRPLKVTLALLWLATTAGSAAPNAKPNIIFLLTDDPRDNSLGAMGHPFVKIAGACASHVSEV